MNLSPRIRFILLVSSIFLVAGDAFAIVPQIVGLGGRGTAGIPKDALFSNPAAVAGLRTHRVFYSYAQSKIRELGAGGRIWTTGVYDGKSKIAKGGLAYIRESRRRLIGGASPYLDSQTIRSVIGRPVGKNLIAGITVNYKMKLENEETENYFTSDVGVIYPLSRALPAGLKVENALDREGERPRNVVLGVSYKLTGPLKVVADYGKTVSEFADDKQLWSLATEVIVFKELIIRGALFRDEIDSIRGTALGVSWNGPRTSFEYALRTTRGAPRERDHVLGVNLQF